MSLRRDGKTPQKEKMPGREITKKCTQMLSVDIDGKFVLYLFAWYWHFNKSNRFASWDLQLTAHSTEEPELAIFTL